MTTDAGGGSGKGSRFSFFVESGQGLKGYLEIALEDLALAPDQNALDAITIAFARTAKQLDAMGFKHDTSFDKPAYGGGGWKGGGAKQEDVAPAGLKVPEHDGQPMRFIAAGKRRDGTAFSPRFVCRADKACTEKDKEGRPFATWQMHDMDGKPFKFADAAAETPPSTPGAPGGGAGTDAAPRVNGQRPRSANWTPFWAQARELGLSPSRVYAILGVPNQQAMAAYDQDAVDEAAKRIVGHVRAQEREPALVGAGDDGKLPFED